MPDWTYQTVFRPILSHLPYSAAQAIAFRSMGLLGRNAIGRVIIRFMGHAQPTGDLAVTKADLSFPAPCGLACGVDVSCQALSATSLFGFGLIEVGPVAVGTETQNESEVTRWQNERLEISANATALSATSLADALRRNSFRNGVSVIVRIVIDQTADPADVQALVDTFEGLVDGFSVKLTNSNTEDLEKTRQQFAALKSKGGMLLAIITVPVDPGLADLPESLGVDGVIIEHVASAAETRGMLGHEVLDAVTTAVKSVTAGGHGKLLIASGGVSEPADALALFEAGADIVLVDSGMAVAGPGLPKRINTAVRAAALSVGGGQENIPDDLPVPHRSWFWAFLLGLSLAIGGIMVFVIGWTRVLLPYDEEFLEMLRDEICSINPHLLPFMSHDRVTLAGTMLSLGPLYMAVAWYGDRLGMHWARVAVLSSSCLGFLSFFLFLGFGYFDPFHAFVATLSFQLMTLCLRSSQPRSFLIEFDLHNSPAWKRAMWGQLLMVMHGAAILLAGVMISSFGVTSVFVPDDLEFMQTTREALVAANPRLVPLVAHDRASFGGMLMATGVTVLLAALWGWQRGRRWLWYTLAGTGTVAYVTTIAIHWAVGYTSLKHLLPAYGGLLFLWLAMLMAKDWMFEDSPVRPVN